jgi:glycosyltransferase involved in cell wall biosynthesis
MNHIENKDRLRILTWHVHGNCLYYLSQAPCTFYIPVKEGRPQGYGGRAGAFLWGENVREIEADRVKDIDFDCILYQSRQNYLEDQYEILSPGQRLLPKIYLEHDPPRDTPTESRHPVDNSEVLLVHVTHFNRLMWDCGRTPTTVIEHGVVTPAEVSYTGKLAKGVVVINCLEKRGRRLGLDLFRKVRKEIPLDLVGMESEDLGGLGEISPPELPSFIGQYRFFFNPIRYTSLGLAVCEAMMIGMPIVGLATTEMSITIKNDQSGYIHTDIDYLIEKMHLLLQDRDKARELGINAGLHARNKFNIARFCQDWVETFENVTGRNTFKDIQAGGMR